MPKIELNELAELTTLHNTLGVIINLIPHNESRDDITAFGGVEAVVKVMKTFQSAEHYRRLRFVPCIT
jgi:hypothetical protein